MGPAAVFTIIFTIRLTLAGRAHRRLLLLGLAAGACGLVGGAFCAASFGLGAAGGFLFAVAGSAILFRTGAGSEEQGAASGKEGNETCHELD